MEDAVLHVLQVVLLLLQETVVGVEPVVLVIAVLFVLVIVQIVAQKVAQIVVIFHVKLPVMVNV